MGGPGIVIEAAGLPVRREEQPAPPCRIADENRYGTGGSPEGRSARFDPDPFDQFFRGRIGKRVIGADRGSTRPEVAREQKIWLKKYSEPSAGHAGQCQQEQTNAEKPNFLFCPHVFLFAVPIVQYAAAGLLFRRPRWCRDLPPGQLDFGSQFMDSRGSTPPRTGGSI